MHVSKNSEGWPASIDCPAKPEMICNMRHALVPVEFRVAKDTERFRWWARSSEMGNNVRTPIFICKLLKTDVTPNYQVKNAREGIVLAAMC